MAAAGCAIVALWRGCGNGRRPRVRPQDSSDDIPVNDDAIPSPDRSVALVGLMGAGKSTVGRRLAARLDMPFVDVDSEVEKAAGQAIPQIFACHGEDAFRAGESRVIARLLQGRPQVLATGGGAFMDPPTRARIAAAAVSVWLRADIEALLARVAGSDDRPLLAGGPRREMLAQLMAERHPVYATADIAVDSGAGSPDEVAWRIVAALRRHLAA